MFVVNPANEKVIKQIKSDNFDSVQKKFAKAARAQVKWNSTPLKARKKTISRFSKLLDSNMSRLGKITSSETGKPFLQATGEIKGTLGRIDYFLKNIDRVSKPTKYSSKEEIRWEPLGVVANISAWNYPYFVGANVYIPALLTGNAVLYKPSELASLTGLEIEKLFKQAGLPSGVFQSLIGGGEIGSALLECDIDGVFFTGSYKTGKKIAQAVAPKMIKTQMELGGKDAAYICEDVNIPNVAAAVADGAFYNCGQSCCAVERILVHKSIAKEFTSEFLKVVKEFQVGSPKEKDTFIGPLTRKEQISVIENQIQDALVKGAKLLLGGKRIPGPGHFFEPTVLSGVNHKMKLMREESFGPIVGIQSVSGDEQALKLMNDTDYGLTSAVYSKSRKRAEKILSEVDSGSAYWNCCDRVNPKLPWSGRRHSGIGSTLSEIGLQTFLQPKAYHWG